MSVKNERPRTAPRLRNTQDNATSALLLNMIRTLTTSSSEDQKELDRRRLEIGFADSSRQIDELVHEHENDVGTCLESFRSVSSKIIACRERVHSVRSGLLACRALLQCRRDDLKRLWMENAQQRHVSTVLAQIEGIRRIEIEVNEAISRSDYVKSANSLKEADSLLNGPFSNIDGLNNLRVNVRETSKKLVEHIIDDITVHLIIHPFEYHLLEVIKALPESKVSESRECAAVLERCGSSSQQDDSAAFLAQTSSHLARCLNALAIFGHFSETLTRFQKLTPSVLLRQIHFSAAIVCVAFSQNEQGDARHLSQYIQLVLNQLQSSYEAHCLLEEEMRKLHVMEVADTVKRVSLCSGYWEMAQNALQRVVSEYVTVASSPTDTSKKTNTSEKITLFKFDASACAASSLSSLPSKQKQSAICPPSPWNITAVYPHLERFCTKREMENPDKKPCILRQFLHSFIVDVFIDRFRCKLERLAENALHGHDAWRMLVHYPHPKVLASCFNMYEVCEEIGKLIETMEQYTERLSALWLLVIDEFAKSATSIYEQIISPSADKDDSRERRKISAAWAVDEDISRLLKSLPNWFMVSSHEATPTPSLTTPTALLPANETESDIRQRNERESEILIGNLGTAKQLVREELITDMELIRSLACMHESVKWFCINMRSLIAGLPESAKNAMRFRSVRIQAPSNPSDNMEEIIYSAVERRLADLDSMADTCLLIIHLELRVHCFFHLLPLARVRPSLPHDELDNEVVDFGRDMAQFHQLLNAHLPVHKMKYLFDGLGHLSASIFIHSSQHMQKLSENGKKRVCRNIFAVQQRLSQLTGHRESELERARTFFELLNHDPDQLLALILERGALFTHLEYTYLLSLAIRSHPVLGAQPGALEQRISQLKVILSQMKKS